MNTLDRAIEALKRARAGETSEGTAHAVKMALRQVGFQVDSEVAVPDRGDGRSGRLDFVARVDGERPVAIEIDWKSPRKKSLFKLRGFDGFRVLVLRAAHTPLMAPHGIDAVLALPTRAPPQYRSGDPLWRLPGSR